MIPIVSLFLFYLTVDCSKFADLQSTINYIQPNSPIPVKVPSPPPAPPSNILQPQPQRTSNEGDVNSNFDANNWTVKSPLITDLPAYKLPSSKHNDWFPNYNKQNEQVVDHHLMGYDDHKNNNEWFSSLNSKNNYNQSYYNHSHNHSYHNHSNHTDFLEKIALINPKMYDLSPSALHRDTKLLSLVYEILSPLTTFSAPLNILHLGTETGFVAVALAVFSRPVDYIVSLDDSERSTARDNIIRDGKEIFLSRLSLKTVTNLSTALIPHPPNTHPYDLIVSSKSINRYTPFPRSLKDSLVPRGIVIYPEEDGTHRRLKIDKIDDNGNLQNIKTIEL